MNGIKVDPMKRAQLITTLEGMLQSARALEPDKKCVSCMHFYEQVDRSTGEVFPPVCRKAKAKIPVEILPVGCEAWDFDDIPF